MLYTLATATGFSVSVSSYGAIITSVMAPDRNGVSAEITLAYDTLPEYLAGHPYYGALVGRTANRITGGGFSIDGTRYDLEQNHGELHLHGGSGGFHQKLYTATVEEDAEAITLHLTRVSADGEDNYPGNLTVDHSITVTTDHRLIMGFHAVTDRPTVCNLTNHCYWNLSGFGSAPSILDHEVQIHADRYAAVAGEAPTGEMVSVADSPFDFRQRTRIGSQFDAVLATGANGYDHSYLVAGALEAGVEARNTESMRPAATVYAPDSGRVMHVATTYPDVHFYTGNNLPGATDRRGEPLSGQEALCLECQFFADSPNRPEFPSVVLRPGETYNHTTEHQFLVE
jgi:aldose 1-epimerase